MEARTSLVLITLAMGSLEVKSPRMLGVFALACALNIACHLYVTYGGLAGALAVFIFLDPCRAHANPRTPRDDNDERQYITWRVSDDSCEAGVTRSLNYVTKARHNDRTSDPGCRSPIAAPRARGRRSRPPPRARKPPYAARRQRRATA